MTASRIHKTLYYPSEMSEVMDVTDFAANFPSVTVLNDQVSNLLQIFGSDAKAIDSAYNALQVMITTSKLESCLAFGGESDFQADFSGGSENESEPVAIEIKLADAAPDITEQELREHFAWMDADEIECPRDPGKSGLFLKGIVIARFRSNRRCTEVLDTLENCFPNYKTRTLTRNSFENLVKEDDRCIPIKLDDLMNSPAFSRKNARKKETSSSSQSDDNLVVLDQVPAPIKLKLRPIAIDANNVCMSHGRNKKYSCLGLELAIAFFRKRGHTEVFAFVPEIRIRGLPAHQKPAIERQDILHKLENEGSIAVVPRKKLANGVVHNPYDDLVIVKYAFSQGGVIISNDNMIDVGKANPEYADFIAKWRVMFMFAGDYFTIMDDPNGRDGARAEELLVAA